MVDIMAVWMSGQKDHFASYMFPQRDKPIQVCEHCLPVTSLVKCANEVTEDQSISRDLFFYFLEHICI